MKTYSVAEFARKIGLIADEAMMEPVVITKHGRPRSVIMSYAQYERLQTGADPRRSLHIGEDPEIDNKLMQALDRHSGSGPPGQSG